MTVLPPDISPGDPGHISHHEEIDLLLSLLDAQSDFLATGVAKGGSGSRPAAAAGNDRLLYYNTDLSRLDYSDGAAWHSLPSVDAAQTWTNTAWFASGEPWVDVRSKGAIGDGVNNDTTAIQNAVNSLPAGRAGLCLLNSGHGPSAYRITATITITNAYVRFGSFGGHGSSGSAARLIWDGAAGGTMLRTNGRGIQLFGFTLHAATKAATCLEQLHSEDYVVEDVEMSENTGTCWIIGDGVANVNNFWCRNVRIRYGNAANGVFVNGPASENVEFHNLNVTVADASYTAGSFLVSVSQAACDFYGLMLDDNNFTGYAIQCTGAGTVRFFNLISEMKQTLSFSAAPHNRGSGIWGGDLRSCDPQAGQYAIEYRASGTIIREGFILQGVRVNRLAGGAANPGVNIINGVACLDGVWFTDVGGVAGTTSGITSSTGGMTAASAVLTVGAGVFTSAMATNNWKIIVKGAGPGGTDLHTTISAFTSSTQVTLAETAVTTVANAAVEAGQWGAVTGTSISYIYNRSFGGVSTYPLVFQADPRFGVKVRVGGRDLNLVSASSSNAANFGDGSTGASGILNAFYRIGSGKHEFDIGNTVVAQLVDPTIANQTYLKIAWWDGAAVQFAQLKLGAAGTGPGGVGRAAYI